MENLSADTDDKKIAVVVVTYNRLKYLKECIAAIRNQSYRNFNLYIIDNASTDGTEEYIKNLIDSRIHYHNTGANLGGAGGFSCGIKKASEEENDYCWVMDDDAVPEINALEELIKSAELLEDRFSFMASRVLWTDGSLCKMNAVEIEKNKLDTLYEECSYGLLPVKVSSFVGCFINMDIAKKVGLPIKEFFIYGDDAEFTLRLSNLEQGYYCPGSVIVHKMPSNVRIGIAEAPEDRLDRYRYEYRNRIYIYRKHNKYGIPQILKIYCKECVKILLRSKTAKGKRIRIVCKGYAEGFKFNPPISQLE